MFNRGKDETSSSETRPSASERAQRLIDLTKNTPLIKFSHPLPKPVPKVVDNHRGVDFYSPPPTLRERAEREENKHVCRIM